MTSFWPYSNPSCAMMSLEISGGVFTVQCHCKCITRCASDLMALWEQLKEQSQLPHVISCCIMPGLSWQLLFSSALFYMLSSTELPLHLLASCTTVPELVHYYRFCCMYLLDRHSELDHVKVGLKGCDKLCNNELLLQAKSFWWSKGQGKIG